MTNEISKSAVEADEAEIQELASTELLGAAGGGVFGSIWNDVKDSAEAVGHVVEAGAQDVASAAVKSADWVGDSVEDVGDAIARNVKNSSVVF